MRKPDLSEAKEIFYDLGAFILALLPRTVSKITGGSVAAVLAVYCIFGHPIYAWLAWLFVALFLFSAAFWAWRDQYKMVCAKQDRALLAKMVDDIKSQKQKQADAGSGIHRYYDALQPAESIGALIKHSDEIQTEADLNYFCDELKKLGYADTLELLWLDAGEFLRGQMLPVLREARLNQQEIKTATQFVSFLAISWSGRDRWKEAQEKWIQERDRNASP